MDISQLKSLADKTNRVIEIEDLLKSLNALAAHSIDSDTSNLTINLNHSCKTDQKIEAPSEHMSDAIEGIFKSLNLGNIKPVMFGTVQKISGPHFSVRLAGRFQFIVFDAIKLALKQEQESLHKEVKTNTGTL